MPLVLDVMVTRFCTSTAANLLVDISHCKLSSMLSFVGTDFGVRRTLSYSHSRCLRTKRHPPLSKTSCLVGAVYNAASLPHVYRSRNVRCNVYHIGNPLRRMSTRRVFFIF